VSRIRYSFVLPVYNEEETLHELYARLVQVISTLDGNSEVLFVDDGSSDDTYRIVSEFQQRDPRVRPIRLSRNFGHQIAISAGIDQAQGDAVIIMDADLQDPPELVPTMLSRWREGYEIVYATREHRQGDSLPKRFLAAAFYRVLRRWSDTDLPVDVGDFRVIDRKAADVFRSLPERSRYVRAMFSWIGFRQIGVPFVREERFAGIPKYSLRMSIKLAVDGLISFSTAPLRFALASGFVIAIMSFIVGAFAVAARLADYYSLPGWASLLLAVSFLGGVQLTVIGVLGLYIERIYNEVKSRPLYVLDQKPGLEAQGLHAPAQISSAEVDHRHKVRLGARL
jgi:glycosyltransferase involved in cell wall biosynthesis